MNQSIVWGEIYAKGKETVNCNDYIGSDVTDIRIWVKLHFRGVSYSRNVLWNQCVALPVNLFGFESREET